MQRLKYWISRAWYWFRCHTYTRYHILDLRSAANDIKWGWRDKDTQILCACFNLLQKFVEDEKALETVDWTWNDDHKRVGFEIRELYHWWTIQRPEEWQAFERSTASWQATEIAETALLTKDDEMLLRLIKIRGYLWT